MYDIRFLYYMVKTNTVDSVSLKLKDLKDGTNISFVLLPHRKAGKGGSVRR